MKIIAPLVSIAIPAFSLYLASRNPSYAAAFPHGEIFRLGLSLLIANVLIWLSRNTDWQANTRFQLFVAGWIWIVVQLGCFIYAVHHP